MNNDERYEAAGDAITRKFSNESLFLNVDDPSRGTWRFVPASQLIFNSPDEGNFQSVRKYLQSFKSLILESGGFEITQLQAPEIPLTPAEAILDQWRTQMDSLRTQNALTDLRFVCEDGVEPAHRVVLAMASDHFSREFTNTGFDQGSPMKCPADPAEVDLKAEGVPVDCVRSLLGKCFITIKPAVSYSECDVCRLCLYWSPTGHG